MPFINIQNVVVNTNYVTTVKLDGGTSSEYKSVSVLIATPSSHYLTNGNQHSKITTTNGSSLLIRQKTALQDYFTSFKNVIDLLLQYQ